MIKKKTNKLKEQDDKKKKKKIPYKREYYQKEMKKVEKINLKVQEQN